MEESHLLYTQMVINLPKEPKPKNVAKSLSQKVPQRHCSEATFHVSIVTFQYD